MAAPDELEGAPREARPQQLLRDERARAGAEAGPGMGARTDLIEAAERCRVAGEAPARPPDEVLVERARARVDVAARHVQVRTLDVGRREHDAPQDRRLEVRDLTREAGLDPVGVRLAQL